ncbi:cadherin-16 [Gastrophryne carolinensis]
MKRIQVPENYRGSFPWYLSKVDLAAEDWHDAELAGNEDGVFALDAESGFLCALQPLDREKRASYMITVMGKQEAVTLQIDVMDENDNMPVISSNSLHGIVSRGSRAGVSFMHIKATDADDPATGNGDLRYKIVQSDQDLFHIDPRSGSVSLTEQGAIYLSEGDGGYFRPLVQVKDLGDSPLGFVASANLEIVAAENTWIPPEPVSIPENHKGAYPLVIAKVLWNSSDVHYGVSGNFIEGLFTIDQGGKIYITGEVDRESQSEYEISVSALNGAGIQYSDPLLLPITVTDDNDNAPIFAHNVYHVEVTEMAARGSLLLELKAEDADDPSTPNAQIAYMIVSQALSHLFHIENSSGKLTLLEAPATNQYTLLVSAADLAGAQGGLSSTVTVIIDVIDINNRPPTFTQNQRHEGTPGIGAREHRVTSTSDSDYFYRSQPFPAITIKEDAHRDTVIVTLTATDEDETSENREMHFSIQAGNEEETFRIKSEKNNSITIILEKALDYERVMEYELVIVVQNRAELLGAVYGPSSTASIIISVEDVNEPPIFKQKRYEIEVLENTQAGLVILTVEAFDPDLHHPARLRYSIQGDKQNWLSIQEDSGDVQLLHSLDREQNGGNYSVQVIAQETGDEGLSTSADLVIHILDVNDNFPILVGNSSRRYLCSPRMEGQGIIIQACDRDSPEHSAPFRFSMPKDAILQTHWMVTLINGTHANLSMKSHNLEAGVYQVPLTITDNGTPPQSKHASITVTICRCTNIGNCWEEAGRMEGMPTVASAVGTIVGTLGAIGIILTIIFAHLAHSRPRSKTSTVDTIPLKTTIKPAPCNI